MHTFFNPDKEGWLWKQGNFFVDYLLYNSTNNFSLPLDLVWSEMWKLLLRGWKRMKECCSSHDWSNNVANVNPGLHEIFFSERFHECMKMLTLYSVYTCHLIKFYEYSFCNEEKAFFQFFFFNRSRKKL